MIDKIKKLVDRVKELLFPAPAPTPVPIPVPVRR